jgi:uncharacterized protein
MLQTRRIQPPLPLANVPAMSAFGYLLGLYGENYERLYRLLGDVRNLSGDYHAVAPLVANANADAAADANNASPDLWLNIIEQHRHTTILRLTHQFEGPAGVELDPLAWVRVYHDSEQAEVTHCHTSKQLKALFSMQVPVLKVGLRRYRMNVFFNKWLEHLLLAGYVPSGFMSV